MDVASDVTRRCKLLDALPLTVIPTPFLQCSLSLRCRDALYMWLSIGNRLHKSVYWLVVVFCHGLHLLQREVSLMKGIDYTYLWTEGQSLVSC